MVFTLCRQAAELPSVTWNGTLAAIALPVRYRFVCTTVKAWPPLPANCTGVIPQISAGTSILTTPKKRDARVLQAMQVVKTFADTADETDINNTLPGFYRQSGRSLSLVMEEYKGAWIFASSNVPSLYCRKR